MSPKKWPPHEQRFWERVDKNGPFILKTRCWVWITDSNLRVGYGRLRVDGKCIYAHRYSFELHKRLLKPGEYACHRCDNGHCVRPSHLFAGTARDNMLDCSAKGRTGRRPKWLTVHMRKSIYEAYKAGNVTQREVAERFGVSQKTVMRVIGST